MALDQTPGKMVLERQAHDEQAVQPVGDGQAVEERPGGDGG